MNPIEASNQEKERQRLRDQFAAAALTGIVADYMTLATDCCCRETVQ